MKPLAILLLITRFAYQGPSLPAPKADPRIAEHLPLAKAMARKFLPNMAGMLELDDLVSIALTATWEAAPQFDDTRGVKFGQFARSCMRLALRREQRSVWNARRRSWLEQDSIHAYGDDERGIELVSPWPNPERAYLALELATAVIAAGNERDRGLLRMLCAGETLDDAGAELGLSRERVRTIQEQAFRIVRRRVAREIAKLNLDGIVRVAHIVGSGFVAPSPTSNREGAQSDG